MSPARIRPRIDVETFVFHNARSLAMTVVSASFATHARRTPARPSTLDHSPRASTEDIIVRAADVFNFNFPE